MTIRLSVCHGRSCRERFAPYVLLRLQNDRERLFPREDIVLDTCLCRNRCEESPVVEADDGLHTRMNPLRASQLLAKLVADAKASIKRTK